MHSNLIDQARTDSDQALTTFDRDLYESVEIATYLYEDSYFHTEADGLFFRFLIKYTGSRIDYTLGLP